MASRGWNDPGVIRQWWGGGNNKTEGSSQEDLVRIRYQLLLFSSKCFRDGFVQRP